MPLVIPNTGQSPEDDPLHKMMAAAMLASKMQEQPPSQPQQAPPPLPPSAEAQASRPISMPAQPMQDVAAQLPPTPQAQPALAHASLADQPATADVGKAQGALDQFHHIPLWKKAIVPALTGAAMAAGAHSWGGKQLQEQGGQAIQQYVGNMRGEQDTLVKQLEFAKQQQQSQYEADQRNRQQDILMAGNNQTKQLMAQIAAQSRLGVADTRYQQGVDVQGLRNTGNRDVQGLRNEGALDVQDSRNTGTANVANIKGGYDIRKAQINATAALNRFMAGQGQENARQARSFEHADTKPSADESRRADLAEAASGYADMLIDIATRRPELFGPVAGRMTNLRQAVGTTDDDVATLKMVREQLGITQMGAHSLRSSQAIAGVADSLVSSFHNDAATTIATANQAKKGLEQFISGPVRPTVYEPNPAAAPPPGAGPAANNPPANRRGGAAKTPLKTQVQTPVTAKTVPVGGVFEGHKYLGGERTNPKSWQAVPAGVQ